MSLDRMARIMMSHFVGVVMLKIIYRPFYRHFFHNGSIVVFSSVTSVSGTFVTRNVMLVTNNITASDKNHRQAALPLGSGNWLSRHFLSDVPKFDKPV